MYHYYTTIFLLLLSNAFMTFAWYGHLKNMSAKPWLIAALVSWGIAFFEYMIQVPANRIGHQVMNIGQLKILQEVLALAVFAPFAVWYLKEKLTLDYLWAGLCLIGAAYFIFRKDLMGE
ncbi:MAG: DMT family protein [Planctomycetaceae bacterium]|nr:DMT family protein [Planctomycetaceae bacterium]